MLHSSDIPVNQFSSVGLEQIEDYPSMKRTDTKFLFHRRKLGAVLTEAASHFSILEIDGVRIAEYRNQYFDTEDLKFYFDHHNRRKNRTKIRLREYSDSDMHFLEIKRKNNKGMTQKIRTPIHGMVSDLTPEHRIFINEQFEEDYDLRPSLRNRFRRITLVHLEHRERATFDFELFFETDSQKARFGNLVIAEVKQYRSNNLSPIIDIFKTQGIGADGFSKYCIGLASLNQGLKQNLFKAKIRKINKITA